MAEIAQRAIEQARELTTQIVASKSVGHKVPPIFAADYATLLGIKQILKSDLDDLDALLLPTRAGYSIKVNSKHHPLRQNFSCAHEIAHVLLDKIRDESSPRKPEFRSNTTLAVKADESLCNQIAAELLMPESLFKSYLSRIGVSVNSIQGLASVFYTSIPATARRIAELSQERCIALYWRIAKLPRWRLSKPCLIWSADNQKDSNSSYEIPNLASASLSSSVFRSFQSNSAIADFENFPLGNIRRPFYIESKAFGQKPHRYIISLVFPDRKV